MKTAAQVQKEVLSLSPAERAQVALAAWESIENDPAFASDRSFDPEGISIALKRKHEIESGQVVPITHEEFLRRTSGK